MSDVADRRTGWMGLGRSRNRIKLWRYFTHRIGLSHARRGCDRVRNGGIAWLLLYSYPFSDGPYGSRKGFTFGNMSKVPIWLYFQSARYRMEDLFKSSRPTDRVFTSCGVRSIVDASIHAKLLLDLPQTGCCKRCLSSFHSRSRRPVDSPRCTLCWHKKPHRLLLQFHWIQRQRWSLTDRRSSPVAPISWPC